MASVIGLVLQHPNTSMLWGHGGQSKREIEKEIMGKSCRNVPWIYIHRLPGEIYVRMKAEKKGANKRDK